MTSRKIWLLFIVVFGAIPRQPLTVVAVSVRPAG